MRRKPCRKGDRFINLFIDGIFIIGFFPFPRYVDFANRGSGRGEEPSGGMILRLIQIRLTTPSFEKIAVGCQEKIRGKRESLI